MTLFGLPSLIGLLIQATGVLLIAILSLAFQNTLRRQPFHYWSMGWCVLFFGLASLLIGFEFPATHPITHPLYLLGEYAFAYLVIIGCRSYVTGARPTRRHGRLLVPGVAVAALLPWLGRSDFNAFFAAHALICTCLFLVAFRVLGRAGANRGNAIGLRVMKIALFVMALSYAHYPALRAAATTDVVSATLPYLEYSRLYGLIFLVLLAFGMVMVATGDVQHELEVVNARLARARDRLEALAQLDHLTSALNRHAFYSIIGDSRRANRVIFRGCAAMADVDNLKGLNDRYGHAAGDVAIRAVATAIRARIRADDLLFRWGGDEFLVLLIGITETDARLRLDSVNQSLRGLSIVGLAEPVDVSVTFGYAPFDSAGTLEEVIGIADTAMYGRKRTGT